MSTVRAIPPMMRDAMRPARFVGARTITAATGDFVSLIDLSQPVRLVATTGYGVANM